MDNAQRTMIEKLESMPLEEARDAIATGKIYTGAKDSDTHNLALSSIAARESALRDARDSENLTISRKALQASEEANKLALDANSIASKARSDARMANIIAISAAIIAITAIIVQWLTKN
jgi:hypothetical protein